MPHQPLENEAINAHIAERFAKRPDVLNNRSRSLGIRPARITQSGDQPRQRTGADSGGVGVIAR